MFEKILIANRGEVAVRIIRTARRMGIKTVVVYSEADADSMAVEMADETVFIGGAPASESYLVADKIVAASRGYIDDVIMPHGTRRRIVGALKNLKGKQLSNPWKKHDNIPL